MKRMLTLAVLLLISMVVKAQEGDPTAPAVQIALNESYTGGKIVATPGKPADDGSVVVTLTVTPDEGYYIKKTDIIVVLTRPAEAAGTRDEVPSIAEGIALGGEEPKDLTKPRDYTFTVEAGFGAWVKEAKFRSSNELYDISSGDKSSNVSWKFDEEKGVMTIKGEGSTKDFTAEADPFYMRDQILSVVIEKGVTSLGANIFKGCTNLASIKIENASKIITLGEDAIPANERMKLDVPANLLNEYKITKGWGDLPSVAIDSEEKIELKGFTFGAKNAYDTYAFDGDDGIIVPSILKAYAITDITDDGLVLTPVTTLPKGEAVLVYNKEHKDIETYYTAGTTEPLKTSSLLRVAGTGGQDVKLGEAYLLHNDVFYFSQEGTIPEGRIYLTMPKSEVSKSRSMYALNGGDGSTAIDSLRFMGTEEEPVWYSLDGRKLNTMPTKKGVYIKNGKKVVIK